MKYKAYILLLMFYSCQKYDNKNADGHWHFIESQLYQTIDIKGDKGKMNKNISGVLNNDIEVDLESKTFNYLLGGKDTLFSYDLIHDTLIVESVNFGKQHKAIKVNNCKPVNDWFYDSPIKFNLPTSDRVYGKKIETRSLSLELVVGEIDEQIKFSNSDSIFNNPKDLEALYNKITSSVPSKMKNKVFVDIYLDKEIVINKLDWLIEALHHVGFIKIYLVFEIDKSDKQLYRKKELKLNQLNDLSAQEYVMKK